jgi:hypothetical protein
MEDQETAVLCQVEASEPLTRVSEAPTAQGRQTQDQLPPPWQGNEGSI